ncbi:nitroreductase/quinone reductase family protein [Mycobacteriaceae bacterium NPDC060252]
MTDLYHRVLQVHRKIYIGTNGLLGHRLLFGNPTLLLRAVGRRTGQLRTTALTYAQDGDTYLVAASNGGSDRPPAWLTNLKATPECSVQIARRRIDVTAAVELPDSPNYSRHWKALNQVNKDRYSSYQQQTARPIPIVTLSPTA